MNKLLTSDRFIAVLAYATLLYVLVEYARTNHEQRTKWIAEFRASPRLAFARTQRDRMVASEMIVTEDCGCGDH